MGCSEVNAFGSKKKTMMKTKVTEKHKDQMLSIEK